MMSPATIRPYFNNNLPLQQELLSGIVTNNYYRTREALTAGADVNFPDPLSIPPLTYFLRGVLEHREVQGIIDSYRILDLLLAHSPDFFYALHRGNRCPLYCATEIAAFHEDYSYLHFMIPELRRMSEGRRRSYSRLVYSLNITWKMRAKLVEHLEKEGVRMT